MAGVNTLAFARVQPKFATYHTNTANVNVHIATSLVGFIGAACLLTRCFVALGRKLSKTGEDYARALSFGTWLAYATALWCSREVPKDVA